VTSDIPVGVGLGSSAAARVAAAALLGDEDPIGTAGREEGHYDNVAAAVMGGVVAVVGDEVHGLPVPDLEVALFVAPAPLATEEARRVLPLQVSREDAVFNMARVAALVEILHSRQWPMLDAALEDRLHQPYRLPLYPWVQDVIDAAREAGAYGAALLARESFATRAVELDPVARPAPSRSTFSDSGPVDLTLGLRRTL